MKADVMQYYIINGINYIAFYIIKTTIGEEFSTNVFGTNLKIVIFV